MIFKSINPFTQSVLAEHEVLSQLQLNSKLLVSELAYKNWKQTTFEQRALLMHKLADLLRNKKEELGFLITNEMGKVYFESISEVEKSAANCDFYAENAASMLRDKALDTPFKSRTIYDPVGAIFAIMPWNYPLWQVLRYAAPTIMAGNVTLLKHAPNVIGCAKAIENLFLEAGFPEGVFQQISIDIPHVEQVIASNIVQGVTLTGSEMAGSAVAALAGKHIKKTVLELGGSDAFIVLDDANLEAAATLATQSRMLNAGQACICAKRFIVSDKIADEFIALFAHKIGLLQQGNPTAQGINMGPLARLDLAEKLESQLRQSVAQGSKIIVGGERDLCNFQPTLIECFSANTIAFQEETFGPLATVLRVHDADQAVAIANDHRYGLAASIWSEDRENAFRLARQIEAGSVFINSLVRSDSRIPFGGIKKSGYGRELGALGIKEFTNAKSVVVE